MVLELTLKHVKALTNLIDQQQQKIIALQSGLQAGKCWGLISIFSQEGSTQSPGLTVASDLPATVHFCTFIGGVAFFLFFPKSHTFHSECHCVPPGMNTY